MIIISNGRIGIVDYFDCWEDLRHRLGKYLEEKDNDHIAEDGERYCVALSVDELLDWMSNIEKEHIKYWN